MLDAHRPRGSLTPEQLARLARPLGCAEFARLAAGEEPPVPQWAVELTERLATAASEEK